MQRAVGSGLCHQTEALPSLCCEPCWTAISSAPTGHVAPCRSLQSLRENGEVKMPKNKKNSGTPPPTPLAAAPNAKKQTKKWVNP